MAVLYTFAPPGDAWTGSIKFAASWHGEITDTYDYHSWVHQWVDYPYVHDYPPELWNYKYTTQVGVIHRIKCSFSVDTLPTHTGYEGLATTIVSLLQYDDSGENPRYWDWLIGVYINYEGKLSMGTPVAFDWSTNTINAGTTYELEFYLYIHPTDPDQTVARLYIDGDLWVEDTDEGDSVVPRADYAMATAGFSYEGPQITDKI